jgi:hypothetical protein
MEDTDWRRRWKMEDGRETQEEVELRNACYRDPTEVPYHLT